MEWSLVASYITVFISGVVVGIGFCAYDLTRGE